MANINGRCWLLWLPCVADVDIIFLSRRFFLLLFSLPNLNGRKLDVCHTSTHGVALVRIWNAGLKCAARGSLEIQDPRNFVGWYKESNYRTFLDDATYTRLGDHHVGHRPTF